MVTQAIMDELGRISADMPKSRIATHIMLHPDTIQQIKKTDSSGLASRHCGVSALLKRDSVYGLNVISSQDVAIGRFIVLDREGKVIFPRPVKITQGKD